MFLKLFWTFRTKFKKTAVSYNTKHVYAKTKLVARYSVIMNLM